MIVFGVDPGMAGGGGTGVVQVNGSVVEWVAMIRGSVSPASDWNVTGGILERIARETWTAIRERAERVGLDVATDDAVLVAAEGYVFQGAGRATKHSWKGPAVTGAIAATRPPWARVVWANSHEVLRRGQYGDLRRYLAAGQARAVDPRGLVTSEHTASAVCHALDLAARRNQTRLAV